MKASALKSAVRCGAIGRLAGVLKTRARRRLRPSAHGRPPQLPTARRRLRAPLGCSSLLAPRARECARAIICRSVAAVVALAFPHYRDCRALAPLAHDSSTDLNERRPPTRARARLAVGNRDLPRDKPQIHKRATPATLDDLAAPIEGIASGGVFGGGGGESSDDAGDDEATRRKISQLAWCAAAIRRNTADAKSPPPAPAARRGASATWRGVGGGCGGSSLKCAIAILRSFCARLATGIVELSCRHRRHRRRLT